jgi:hypothetical protein
MTAKWIRPLFFILTMVALLFFAYNGLLAKDQAGPKPPAELLAE